jgi:YD repeat-containing protein
MVAVVSGSGLGLFNASTSPQGAQGDPVVGRGNDRVYVNSANGNLIVQSVDDVLVANGPDTALVRTYNSQGLLDGDNDDNWRIGFYRRVVLNGPLNDSDSTVTKTFGDGAEIVYRYDTTTGLYTSTDGDGAHDSLSFSGSEWTWTDGTTRVTETYDSNGRLSAARDSNNNTIQYLYTGNLLTQVIDASGQSTFLQYVGNNLASVRVVSMGQEQTLTLYKYDTQNRLIEVHVDTTWYDGNTDDHLTFVTTYRYVGTTNLLAETTQRSGQATAVIASQRFTYELIGGAYRVKTVTDAENRTTTFDYTLTSNAGGVSTTFAPADAGDLHTTDIEITETPYPRIDAALTTPAAGWGTAALLETANGVVIEPKVAFDSQGNGFAVWAQGGDVFARRYTRVNDTWAAAVTLDGNGNTASAPTLALDAAGNAVAAWSQSNGSAVSAYGITFNATTGTWGTAALLENTNLAVATTAYSVSASIAGTQAAVAFLQTDGTRNNAYVARWNGATWAAAALVETRTNVAAQPSVAVDSLGNVSVVLQQSNGTANSIYVNRYAASTATWSGATLLENSNTAVIEPKIAFDGNGNGFAVWSQGADVYARRYTRATNTWAAAVTLDGNGNTSSAPALAVDAAGNAVAAWAQSNGTAVSTYAAVFNTATGNWGAGALLENTNQAVATTAYSISASVRGTRAAVAWLQTDGTRNNAYVANWNGSTWSAASLVEARTNAAAQPSVAIDALGNAVVAIQQSNGSANSLYTNRFVGDTTPYYLVTGGNTWRSIANAVYGVDSDAAGQELSGQLTGQTLAEGNHLTGFPPTLEVPTSTVVNVPAYYIVLASDDWGSITETVYGTRDPNAVLALQGATGNPTLSEDLHLTVPMTLRYTASGAVSITVGNPAISTTDNVTTTQQYGLQPGAPSNAATVGWQPMIVLENRPESSTGQYPVAGVNASGDGYALWADGNNVTVRRFDAGTQTWGAETVIDSAGPYNSPAAVVVDDAGNALAVWQRYNFTTGVTDTLASRFSAASGTWGPTALIANGGYPGTNYGAKLVRISDAGAAIAFQRYEAGIQNLYVTRNLGAGWTTAQLVDTSDQPLDSQGIALDDAGNITLMWLQSDGVQSQVTTRRWLASSGSLSQVTTVTSAVTSNETPAEPQLVGDAHGNLFAVWRSQNHLVASVFDATTNTWGASQSIAGYSIAHQLATDAAGNAVIASVLATGVTQTLAISRYDRVTGTWSLPETAAGAGNLQAWSSSAYKLLVEGDNIAVSWDEHDPTTGYSAVSVMLYRDGALAAPRLLGYQATGQSTSLSMDAAGNVIFLESRQDGQWYSSPYVTRFNAPYYTVPSGATWRSVANTLYGVDSVAAGDALRDELGNPPLTEGYRLINLPVTLTVNTTAPATVPPYYVVQAGDSWTSIAQAVYGTTSERIEETLRRVTGDPILAAGLHLSMPATLYYGSDTIYLQTDVTDALGAVDTWVRDAQGRVTAHRSPAVDGVRVDDRFEYDAAGNLTRVTRDFGGLNRVTDLAYDANGNLTDTWDALGNATRRTYDEWNQLLTETLYTGVDPDRDGALVASGAMVTQYVHDGSRNLRFVVSADQRVVEYRYNGFGLRISEILYPDGRYTGSTFTETELANWTYVQDLERTQRTDYFYDLRGNLQNVMRYERMESWGSGDLATASVAAFQYDQRGRLQNQYSPQGLAFIDSLYDHRASSSRSYDLFGNVMSAGNRIDAYNTHDEYRFDEISNMASVTEYGSYWSVPTSPLYSSLSYNRAGEVVSTRRYGYIDNAPVYDTTTYAYDAAGRMRMATDSLGVRTYKIYDAMDRLVGEIDGEGRLTRYFYNHASENIKAVRYSSLLSTDTLATLLDAQGRPTQVSIDTLVESLASVAGRNPSLDQVSRTVFDAAGRLVYTIDALGGVTQTHYDGASRVTGTTAYANPLSVAIPDSVAEVSVAQLAPGGAYAIGTSSEDDRITRNFYDADGNLRAVLDAEGYLTEFEYDSAGRLVEQVAYANLTPAVERASGTLDSLRPAADLPEHTDDPESDIRSYFFHDIQGRRVAEVNGEGYLTETVYDRASNVAQLISYENAVTVDTNSTLASLRPVATGVNRTTSFRYDGLRRVVEQTNYEGTITRTQYDAAGDVLSMTTAAGTAEARTTQAEVDSLGRISRTLSAEGSAAIAGGMDATTAWSLYGTRYRYDTADHLVATIDPNGARALFYYDKSGRARFTVRDLGDGTGELSEMRYDALGQATVAIAYSNRISTASLNGGLVDGTILARATAAYAPDQVTIVTSSYRRTGELEAVTDAVGAQSTFGYNTFGEVTSETSQIAPGRAREHTYDYDRRGLQTSTVWEPAGINRTATVTYDAFGRQTSVTDQYGNVSRLEYDTVGRIVASVDTLGNRVANTYDAFSRVRTTTDELQRQTIYSYDDAARSATVTTPEGITLTTVHYRDGQTFTSTDSAGAVTTYHYDANGQLQSVSDNLGTLESRTYDRAGRLETVTDGRDVITRLGYDAANRVLTRTRDHGGLALQTVYEYDGQGRVIRVTEPGDRVTRTTYYADGQVHEVIVDENGLALRTEYQYDGTKNVVTVTENADGAGPDNRPRRTEYRYDDLGRRTHQIVDPEGLNLVTEFRYDRNGNVTRKIDAELNSTWYVYDAAGQLLQTIDALGGVSGLEYDDAGRVVLTRRHANSLLTAPFLSQDTLGFQTVAASAQDHVSRSIYDGDGRERFTIATSRRIGGNEYGVVTERTFDDHGNVAATRVHDQEILIPAAVSEQGIDALVSDSSADRLQTTIYDVRDRAVFLVDVYGGVTRQWFDDAGNLVRTTSYATATDAELTLEDLDAWALAHAADEANRNQHFWYDAVGRVRFALDAERALTESRYLDGQRQEVSIAYAGAPSFDGTATLAWIEQHLPTDAVNDRKTVTTRDGAGRAVLVERELDFGLDTQLTRTLSEAFTYDGIGNKRTYRNANGDVWTYRYDANGRLTDEISPSVAVTTISEQGGNLVASAPQQASIITRMTYDGLGNVETRTEGIRLVGGSEITAGSRTTTYVYDLLGRQTGVIHPEVMVYDHVAALDDEQDNVGTGTQRVERQVTPTSLTVYNALGDAVMNVDVSGARARKAYDELGRVKFEVDALGYVSEYGYDVFGNVLTVTRYATQISAASLPAQGVWSAAEINAWTGTSTDDRTITSQYDRMNRRSRVLQPQAFAYTAANAAGAGMHSGSAVGRTDYEYNVFGELSLERRLLNEVTQQFADTRYFYDAEGRRTHTLDALGYVTENRYDARGNVTEHIEYSRRLAASANGNARLIESTTHDSHPGFAEGYDRRTQYVFDSLDRVRVQRVYEVEIANGNYLDAENDTTFGVQELKFEYDAVGNRVQYTDAYGAVTRTYYDKLGRIRAVAEPVRNADTDGDFVANNDFRPLVEMHRDVFGNLVEQVRFGTSATNVTDLDYTAPSGGPALWTRMDLDLHGRARRTQDSTLAIRYFSYDTRGQVAKEWETFSDLDGKEFVRSVIHEYDALGREISTIEPQRRNDTVPAEPPTGLVTRNPTWYDGGPAWLSHSIVELSWSDLGTDAPVYIILRYTRLNHQLNEGDTHSQSITTTGARTGWTFDWQDDGNGNGGVYSIDRILVYTENGQTLLRDSWNTATPVASSNSQVAYAQMKYNAFGELIARGVNAERLTDSPTANYQESWQYDNAGRVWKSNAGDGVFKVYLYDVAGRNTAEIRSKGNGTIADAPTPGSALGNANTIRTEQVYDALDHAILTRMPELEVDTALAPAISDVFINVFNGEPAIYWTGTLNPDVTVTFEYYSSVEQRWIQVPVVQISPTQIGALLTGLDGPQFDYRVSLRKALQFQPYARTRGTFHFNETRVVTIDQIVRTAPEPAIATLVPDHAAGIITWAAPADNTVNATMRFQRDGTSTWINVDAVRQGSTFVVDARHVLTQAGAYGYQIVYDRENYLIALNTGGLSVGETTYTRVFSTQSNSNTTVAPGSATIPGPGASSVSGRYLVWQPLPPTTLEGVALVPKFYYRQQPSGTYLTNITPLRGPTNLSVNLGSLAAGTYDYILEYTIGDRVVSRQPGTFVMTDGYTTITDTTTVAPYSGPPATPPISSITGTGGVGGTVTWSNLFSQYLAFHSTVNGQDMFSWNYVNVIRPSWAGGSNTGYVVIEYMTSSVSTPGWNETAYPTSEFRTWSGTMTRDVDNTFSLVESTGTYGAGYLAVGGFDSISRIRVYSAQGGTLIADSSNAVPSPRSLLWAAPANDPNITAKVYYELNGTWTFVGDAARGGNTFTINIDAVPNGQRHIMVQYFHPDENWAFNTAIATLTLTTGNIPHITNQGSTNHDPAWFMAVNGHASNGTISWSGPALTSGDTVSIEYLNGSNQWVAWQTWTSGSSFSFDASSLGTPGGATYSFRIMYRSYLGTYPYRKAQGTFTATRDVDVYDPLITLGTPAPVTTNYTAAVIEPHHTGTSLQWTHARGAPENTIRITYRRQNQAIPYVEYIQGDGPTYDFTFPGIENTGGSVPVLWTLEYFRPNETNSFARASGQTQLTALRDTNYPNVHINFQYAVFPSGLLEIPVPYQDPNNPNVLRWNLAPSNGASVLVHVGGSSFIPSADGLSVDLTQLEAGESYEYDIMFIGQGATAAYARARGTLRMQRSTVLDNLQVQRFPGGGAYDHAPVEQRTLDRWGNVISDVNTAHQETLFRYNVFGLLTATRNPLARILDTRRDTWGGEQSQELTDWSYTKSYYDLMGRALATRDENGNVNGVSYNSAGQKVAEWHADTGSKSFLHDGFGRQAQVIDEIGWRTQFAYDAANRQTQIKTEFRPNEWITRQFTYDALGNRTSETSGALALDGQPEKTSYFYDLAGHVIRRRSGLNAETKYEYDVMGHKTAEIDPLRVRMTWDFDRFGRVEAHVDLGGFTTNYFYNGAGLLDLQTSSRGQNLNYEYDSAGNVRTIIDGATGRSVVYGYDSAGRRATERTLVNNVVHQDSQILYDERGRIGQLADLRYALEYRYDAAGNRTKTTVRYLDHELELHEDELDYEYDMMNRVILSDTSSSITYNLAGQRDSAVMYGTLWVRESATGVLSYGGNPGYQNADPRTYTETYSYDGAGRLYSTWRTGLNAAGQAVNREVEYREYDDASRLIRIDDKIERTRTRYTYNDDGHVTQQITRWSPTSTGEITDTGPLKSVATFVVDAAGVQRSYVVDTYKRSETNPALSSFDDHYEYTNTYRSADSYLLQVQNVSGQLQGGSHPGPYTGRLERTYDVNNQLVKLHDDSAAAAHEYRYIANNLQGEAMTAIEGNFANASAVTGGFQLVTQGGSNPYFAQHFFHANGKYVGSFGQLHGTGVDDDPLEFKANFDTNFTPISDQFPAPTPSNIVVQEGDTLRGIAARIFGDSSLWYLLAEENGLTDPDVALPVGSTLRVPNSVYSLSNTSEVFKPFDVNEVIGDKAASMRYIGPPHEIRLCGMEAKTFLTVLAIVVTLIVSYFLPAASGPLMAFFNGAIAAAVGNGVSQGVGIWSGVQSQFNWDSLGMSALSGGIGAGVTSGISGMEAFQGRPVAAGFVGGAVGNAVTQGAAIMLDLQESFDWSGVAASALSSAASTKAGLGFDQAFGGVKESFGYTFGRTLVTGTTSSVVNAVFGGKIEPISIVADAFGTALGNSITKEQSGAPNPDSGSGGKQRESVYDRWGQSPNATGNSRLSSSAGMTNGANDQLSGVSAENAARDAALSTNPDNDVDADGSLVTAAEAVASAAPMSAGSAASASRAASTRSGNGNPGGDASSGGARATSSGTNAARSQGRTNAVISEVQNGDVAYPLGPDGMPVVYVYGTPSSVDSLTFDNRTPFLTDRMARDNIGGFYNLVNPTTGAVPIAMAPNYTRNDPFATPFTRFQYPADGPYGFLFNPEPMRTPVAGVDFNPHTGKPYPRNLPITAADDYYQAQREVGRRFLSGRGGFGTGEALGFWAGSNGRSRDPIGTYEAGRTADELFFSGGSTIGGAPPSFTGASPRSSYIDRAVGQQQAVRVGELGRRVNEPIVSGPTNAGSRREFLDLTRQLKPDTTYSYGGFSYTTDSSGRARYSEGFLQLDAGGNRVKKLDANIGKSSGVQGDIGFHHGGDQFGFMGGNANLTPGSHALNSSAYKSFETRVKGDLIRNPGQVYGRFEAVYIPGNTTKRPNYYTAVVSINGKTAYRAVFPNTPPGRRGP